MNVNKRNNKLSVVIGSGGIKSYGSIALFKFLEELGVGIDLLVGCSGGAQVCSLKALGYAAEKMMKVCENKLSANDFKCIDYNTVGALIGIPGCEFSTFSGFFKSYKIMAVANKYFGDKNIEDLQTKLIIQATDVESGNEVRLEKGSLLLANYASGATLPFLHPIEFQGKLLADGAYTNPLPISTALDEGADLIIALGFEEKSLNPKGLFESTEAFISKVIETRRGKRMALVFGSTSKKIIYIHVNYANTISIWDIDSFPYVIEKTKEAVASKAELIKECLSNF